MSKRELRQAEHEVEESTEELNRAIDHFREAFQVRAERVNRAIGFVKRKAEAARELPVRTESFLERAMVRLSENPEPIALLAGVAVLWIAWKSSEPGLRLDEEAVSCGS